MLITVLAYVHWHSPQVVQLCCGFISSEGSVALFDLYLIFMAASLQWRIVSTITEIAIYLII